MWGKRARSVWESERSAEAVNAAALRRSLEAFHGKQDPQAVDRVAAFQQQDRYIRAAARTALEHQPLAEWQEKALSETNVTAQLEALLALARRTGVCPRPIGCGLATRWESARRHPRRAVETRLGQAHE
jgi:hypothetical protein